MTFRAAGSVPPIRLPVVSCRNTEPKLPISTVPVLSGPMMFPCTTFSPPPRIVIGSTPAVMTFPSPGPVPPMRFPGRHAHDGSAGKPRLRRAIDLGSVIAKVQGQTPDIDREHFAVKTRVADRDVEQNGIGPDARVRLSDRLPQRTLR